jgi:hypothetical protein
MIELLQNVFAWLNANQGGVAGCRPVISISSAMGVWKITNESTPSAN